MDTRMGSRMDTRMRLAKEEKILCVSATAACLYRVTESFAKSSTRSIEKALRGRCGYALYKT